MTAIQRKLLILGCADRKRDTGGLLPALDRYDGPAYRVLRKFLRAYQWPENLSVGVLSAKYGLFGVFTGIEDYDVRMDMGLAQAKSAECSATLKKWAASHESIYLSLGREYLPALQPALETLEDSHEVFPGGQGEKLHHIKTFLMDAAPDRRVRVQLEAGTGQCTYFLPDWDDLLDPAFDFEADAFSKPTRSERVDKHCCVLMKPDKMSDGILVSLAQQASTKGPLRRIDGTDLDSLAPPPLRRRFGLTSQQYLFGDCGAFSYVNEDVPTIGVDQAVAMYEAYGFDFGASVDHIPVPTIAREGERTVLTKEQRQARVDLTTTNAEAFMAAHSARHAQFNPVGTIQGIESQQFGRSVQHYYDIGYRHIAIGGLVTRSDKEIAEITRMVSEEASRLTERPWIHLFGIYRPKLQQLFKELRIDSFDSASYFRKAWLRSDQNYLGTNGHWYAAIRVPMTKDGRIRAHAEAINADLTQLAQKEASVLRLLTKYGHYEAQLSEVVEAVADYDSHLTRSSEVGSMRSKYTRTLVDRPWEQCRCRFCKELGIHILIFRGANRNKRRGAHNTLMLYNDLQNRSIYD